MVKDFLRLGKGVNHNATGMSRPKQPQSRRIDCGMNGERLVCSTNLYIVTLARMAAIAAMLSPLGCARSSMRAISENQIVIAKHARMASTGYVSNTNSHVEPADC